MFIKGERNGLQYVSSRSDKEPALTWHDIKEKANDLWNEICERNPEYSDRGFIANMGWVARFVRRNNITLQVTNSASTITPKLVSSGDSSIKSSTIIDDVMQSVISISTGTSKVALSPSTSQSTSSSPTGADATAIVVLSKVDGCPNEAVAMATSSAKKRRKNFIPKKVVANDAVCSTAIDDPEMPADLASSDQDFLATAHKGADKTMAASGAELSGSFLNNSGVL
ncbi:unnamed protein product [Gongylonema pulchrum]|uniref:HTH CENPB-type domain-containing protein n=1 Tax=Gongylonema pulchrum TaxID=637853 RepID=A0A3P6PMA9_9BILA|nr:unnamed protein product [Gongylonema pulchrum]